MLYISLSAESSWTLMQVYKKFIDPEEQEIESDLSMVTGWRGIYKKPS